MRMGLAPVRKPGDGLPLGLGKRDHHLSGHAREPSLAGLVLLGDERRLQ